MISHPLLADLRDSPTGSPERLPRPWWLWSARLPGPLRPSPQSANPGAVSPAGTVLAAGHASSPGLNADSGLVPFGPANLHVTPAHQPALRVPVPSGSSSRQLATVQHPTAASADASASAGNSGSGQSSSGQSASAASSAPAGPTHAYRIYDSVTPAAIPAGHRIATYATGGYAVNPSQVTGRNVLWIDTQGTDPRAAALDVEPGDATPATAAHWVWHKLHNAASQIAIIYTMRSEWPAVQAAVSTLPQQMQTQVRWWIADPTGYPHIVPGASATQWYWGTNYDISTAKPGF